MIKVSHVLESVSIFHMFPHKHMPHIDTHMWSVYVCVCSRLSLNLFLGRVLVKNLEATAQP